MEETSATAMLVGTPEMFAARSDGLTATVPRDEIAAALASEPPDELVLDILRNVEGAEGPERRTVNVAWNRTDLESLLEELDSEAITFSFDPAELEQILSQPEVEGHGLREVAVVLGIAAAAAAAGSGSAQAMYGEPGVKGPTAQPQVVVGIHDEATFAARGIESAPAATHDEATFAARGIESAPAATHDEATFAARGIESAPATVAAIHDEATFAARGIESPLPADTATSATASRFDLPSVDPAMAAGIAAALAAVGLAILGATFTHRRTPGAV